MRIVSDILRIAGSPKIRKIKLDSKILKLAMMFIDYEANALPPAERMIEYGFTMSKLLGKDKCKILDIGCVARHNYLIPSLCFAGWDVWGIDIRDWAFQHTNFHKVKGDIRYEPFMSETFDIVSCVSTIEHIGLASYYGITEEDLDGDLEAMIQMRRVLKVGGTLLLTVPYSNEYIIRPGARIYGHERLDGMLNKFTVISKKIYIQQNGVWIETDENIDREGLICLELIKN